MLGKALRRAWYKRHAHSELSRLCLASGSPGKERLEESQLVAIDIETTGLDPASAEIASIGWVEIRNARIRLGSLRHVLVQVQRGVQHSATIHEITDSELQSALSLEQAILELMRVCSGKVLVFHYTALDVTMLSSAARALCGVPLLADCIDTLKLEQNRLQRHNIPLQSDSLRLHSCRDRYHLPPARVHNAALDALATAELLLAIVEHRGGASRVRTKDLLTG